QAESCLTRLAIHRFHPLLVSRHCILRDCHGAGQPWDSDVHARMIVNSARPRCPTVPIGSERTVMWIVWLSMKVISQRVLVTPAPWTVRCMLKLLGTTQIWGGVFVSSQPAIVPWSVERLPPMVSWEKLIAWRRSIVSADASLAAVEAFPIEFESALTIIRLAT